MASILSQPQQRGETGSEDLALKREFFISSGLVVVVVLFSQSPEAQGRQKDGVSNHNNPALSVFPAGLYNAHHKIQFVALSFKPLPSSTQLWPEHPLRPRIPGYGR